MKHDYDPDWGTEEEQRYDQFWAAQDEEYTMDAVKEYSIENGDWLAREFTTNYEAEFKAWLDERSISLVTQEHHETFAQEHVRYWSYVAERMRGYEE